MSDILLTDGGIKAEIERVRELCNTANAYFDALFSREILARDQKLMAHLAKTSDHQLMLDLTLNIIAREKRRIGSGLSSGDVNLYCEQLWDKLDDCAEFFSWFADHATSDERIIFLTYGIDDGYRNFLDITAGLEPDLREPFRNRLAQYEEKLKQQGSA